MTLLKISDQNIKLDGEVFLKGINISIESGKCYHIIGDNGSGKSTLLDYLAQAAKDLNPGYLPQVAHQYPKVHFLLKDISSTEYPFYSKSLFNKTWHNSSGGERKKSLISKTIAEGAKIVILDEPFNHLDSTSSKQIVSCLEDIIKKGVSVIYTAHESVIKSSIKIEVNQWRL